MNKIDIVIDGKVPARNALLLLDKGKQKPLLNISYINCYPIKVGEFTMVTPDNVLEFKDGVFEFKNDVVEEVKKFYNTQLTNQLNIILHMLADAYVDNYETDIKDVIEASKTDEDVRDALARFNASVSKILTQFQNEDHLTEIDVLLASDAVTAVYPFNVSTGYLHTELIPVNQYLEKGKVLSVGETNPDEHVKNLFKIFREDIGESKNPAIYIDGNDNEYFVIRKDSNYFIRKQSLDVLFKLSKFIPV